MVRDEEDIERELQYELAAGSGEPAPSPASTRSLPCARCGDFHPEPDMLWLDGERWCPRCLQAIARSPWRPALIAGISFFLGFWSAGVLTALNRRRLGYDIQVAPRVAGWLILGVVVTSIFAFLPEGLGRGVGLGVNIAALLYFKQVGEGRYDTLKRAGAPTGSVLSAIGIALVAGVSALGVALGLMVAVELIVEPSGL